MFMGVPTSPPPPSPSRARGLGILSLGVFFAGLLIPGCADIYEVEPETVGGSQSLKGGSSTLGSATQGVVELRQRGGSFPWCTGALINNHALLTTARCLEKFVNDGEFTTDYGEFIEPYMSLWRDREGEDPGFVRTCITSTSDALDPQGRCVGAKPKRIYLYRPKPIAFGNVEDDLAILYSDAYAYKRTGDDDYADIYVGDVPSLSRSTGPTVLSLFGHGFPYESAARVGVSSVASVTNGSLTMNGGVGTAACLGDTGGPWMVPASSDLSVHAMVVGLHSGNTASVENGCTKAGASMRATRLRDKMAWIESIVGPCADAWTEDGLPVKRCYRLPSEPSEFIKRTVVMIYGQTQPGQDMFVRGGLDHGQAKALLGRDCTAANHECAIPVSHRNLLNSSTKPWKMGEHYLDWYGVEATQTGISHGIRAEGTPFDWTTNVWPPEWGPKRTTAVHGFGEEPLNQWGQHYWMLDADIDCSKGFIDKEGRSWFEIKSFISKGPGWEPDVSPRQNTFTDHRKAPYSSINHFAECGKLNVFKRGDGRSVVIKDL